MCSSEHYGQKQLAFLCRLKQVKDRRNHKLFLELILFMFGMELQLCLKYTL